MTKRKPVTLGYLRVSTKDQNPDRQVLGLNRLCDKLYVEKLSAVASKRPVFEKVISLLRSGDTLLVWDLDRAFRSTEDAIAHDKMFQHRGIILRAMNFEIDTLSADGRHTYITKAAQAEFERMKISERTIEGLKAARLNGKQLGRRPKLSDAQIKCAKLLIEEKVYSRTQLAARLGVHPWTLSRNIKRLEQSSFA